MEVVGTAPDPGHASGQRSSVRTRTSNFTTASKSSWPSACAPRRATNASVCTAPSTTNCSAASPPSAAHPQGHRRRTACRRGGSHRAAQPRSSNRTRCSSKSAPATAASPSKSPQRARQCYALDVSREILSGVQHPRVRGRAVGRLFGAGARVHRHARVQLPGHGAHSPRRRARAAAQPVRGDRARRFVFLRDAQPAQRSARCVEVFRHSRRAAFISRNTPSPSSRPCSARSDFAGSKRARAIRRALTCACRWDS